jgi:hypothetical protein
MLIVLDNAHDAEQVLALLPDSPSCAVIVTSRRHLTSLVTTNGAHPLALDLLTTDEARRMLAERLGKARTAIDPDAVDEIIAGCARLPLALAVVAARAATYPSFSLAMLAEELRDNRAALGALSSGDPRTDVRTVFSWSYHALTPAAAKLFRLLGQHAGPDISAAAAASLIGSPVARIRPVLAELVDAQVLMEHSPGRYAFHDLLRAYAWELAGVHDTLADRQEAILRVLDHYLHTAHAAELLLNPYQRDPIELAPARPGVTPERLDTDRPGDGLVHCRASGPGRGRSPGRGDRAPHAPCMAAGENTRGVPGSAWALAGLVGHAADRRRLRPPPGRSDRPDLLAPPVGACQGAAGPLRRGGCAPQGGAPDGRLLPRPGRTRLPRSRVAGRAVGTARGGARPRATLTRPVSLHRTSVRAGAGLQRDRLEPLEVGESAVGHRRVPSGARPATGNQRPGR